MKQYGSTDSAEPRPQSERGEPSPGRPANRRRVPLLPISTVAMGAASFLPSTITTVASAVGAGVVGGILFDFSNFVMQALASQHAEAAVATMNAINVNILNPLFFLLFMGTTATSAATIVIGIVKQSHPSTDPLRLTGAALYVVGVFGVTAFCNVPLNDKLAKTVVNSTQQGAIDPSLWTNYMKPWMRWNHVRVVASIIASTLLTVSLTR